MQKEWALLEDIVLLKQADSIGTGLFTENPFAEYLLALKEKMKEETVPLTIKDLPVGGADLETVGIEPRFRAEVLRTLLEQQADEGARRDRAFLLAEALRVAKELRRKA